MVFLLSICSFTHAISARQPKISARALVRWPIHPRRALEHVANGQLEIIAAECMQGHDSVIGGDTEPACTRRAIKSAKSTMKNLFGCVVRRTHLTESCCFAVLCGVPFKAGEEQLSGSVHHSPCICGRALPRRPLWPLRSNFLIRGRTRVMDVHLPTKRVLFFEPAYFDISLIIISGGVSALALR